LCLTQAELGGLPAGQIARQVWALKDREGMMPRYVRRLLRRSLKLLKSVVARLELEHFPGSCCG
jgi:hypothetical protein